MNNPLRNPLCLLFSLLFFSILNADNQTPTVSPILPGTNLPFQIEVELADFSLPIGVQSNVFAQYRGKWLLLAGRINGLHGFDPGDDNFPPNQQNRFVIVVDPCHKTVKMRALTDPDSGLNQTQVDSLSTTSPQGYQKGKTLYMTGGYGVDSLTGDFSTKDILTAIDVPGLIHWVTDPCPGETAAQHIRQISHPVFQITGGYMTQFSHEPTLLVFGQNYQGAYHPDVNGDYSRQVRRFDIIDDEYHLDVVVRSSKPMIPDPSYRRRDLNVVPVIEFCRGKPRRMLAALSGVFTLSGGAWTVPVSITPNGKPSMADPFNPETFKQGMNNYNCATLGLFSKKHQAMYTILFGGISYGFFENGQFQTDSELPFINQITTIEIDKHHHFQQYIMDATFPTIISQQSNPGNTLLFGAEAVFIPNRQISTFATDIFNFDKLHNRRRLLGYIVGGIQSTLPNTNSSSDSAASPYIFKVWIRTR